MPDSTHDSLVHAAANDRDHTAALALADHLDETGQPGGGLLREGARFGFPVYDTPFRRSGDPRGFHMLHSPAGHIRVYREYDRDDRPFIGVLHRPTDGSGEMFHYHIPIHSLKQWVHVTRDWPKDVRKLLLRALKARKVPVASQHDPVQLARMRVPAGGIIVNNVYQKGGQFMQKAFKRIRNVAAKLKLARSEKNHYAELRSLQQGAGSAVVADWLQEKGHPGAHIARAATPLEDIIPAHGMFGAAWPVHEETVPDESNRHVPLSTLHLHVVPTTGDSRKPAAFYVRTHHDTTVQHRALVRSIRHLLALTSDYPKDVQARIARTARHVGMPIGPPEEPMKLARDPAQTAQLPGSPFHGSEAVNPLTVSQLKQMEDDHALPKHARLSPLVKHDKPELGDASTFTAKAQHVARFLNHLTKQRLKGHELRKALTDPSRTDDQKASYAALHMMHEAKEFLDATRANGAGEWYGEHVNDLEKTVHHIFGKGFEPGGHRQTLFKALTALSSSGTNPKENALVAYRMLREGMKRRPDHPFLGVPAYNEAALHEWLARAGGVPTNVGYTNVDPHTPPVAEYEWYKKHVLPKADTLDRQSSKEHRAGYMNRPVIIVDKDGHPDHGKMLEYQSGEDWIELPEAGELYNRHRGTGAIRQARIPVTDEQGRLRPKGWNAQGAQVERGVERLQKLIRTFGEENAAEWLLTPQKDSTFQRMFEYTPDRAQIGSNEHLPGAFLFGPKFGAFLLNLHGNTPDAAKHARWLTADKWWSRSWNRFMGTLLHGAGRGEHVESPRGRGERNLMARAAREATAAAGLRSVAELQAVMWYYEQSLWRTLGVKQARSYSFRDGAKAMLAAHEAGKAK